MRYHTEPNTDWKNIFELWRDNAKKLPFKVVRSTGSAEASHFLVVKSVQLNKWPYGDAWGQYHWRGQPTERKKTDAARMHNWRILE